MNQKEIGPDSNVVFNKRTSNYPLLAQSLKNSIPIRIPNVGISVCLYL